MHPALQTIRRWLRSDMRIMRWVFLTLYVALLLTFLIVTEGDSAAFIMLGVFLAAQAMFILGAGTMQLCRPIRRRRLLVPIIAAAFMFTVLLAGFLMAMTELLKLEDDDWVQFLVFGALALSWIGWGILLYFHVRYHPRFRAISRIANMLFAGSLLELLATVPSHVIVSRRPGCLVGIMTMMGIIAGCSVMFFSFGPMILLLFLRPRYRREQLDDTHPICQACGYDLRASTERCPECGLPFATTSA